jgi:glutamate synthase (NADPH/NADH) large chain
MVMLEPVLPASGVIDDPERPRQRSISAYDAGMGDMLRFDAERLLILIERHLLYTGSKRAREILENWDEARARFVKVLPLDYRRALLDLQAERRAAAE